MQTFELLIRIEHFENFYSIFQYLDKVHQFTGTFAFFKRPMEVVQCRNCGVHALVVCPMVMEFATSSHRHDVLG